MIYHIAVMSEVGHEFPTIMAKTAKLKYISEMRELIALDIIKSIVQKQVGEGFLYGVEVENFSQELFDFFAFDLMDEVDKFFWRFNPPEKIVKRYFDPSVRFIAYLISKFEHGLYDETLSHIRTKTGFYLYLE